MGLPQNCGSPSACQKSFLHVMSVVSAINIGFIAPLTPAVAFCASPEKTPARFLSCFGNLSLLRILELQEPQRDRSNLRTGRVILR